MLDSMKPAVPPATRCISGCFFLGAGGAAAAAAEELDLSSEGDVMIDGRNVRNCSADLCLVIATPQQSIDYQKRIMRKNEARGGHSQCVMHDA